MFGFARQNRHHLSVSVPFKDVSWVMTMGIFEIYIMRNNKSIIWNDGSVAPPILGHCRLWNRFPLQYRSVHFFICRFHIRVHSLSRSRYTIFYFSKWTAKNRLFSKKNSHSKRENFKIFWKAGPSGTSEIYFSGFIVGLKFQLETYNGHGHK